MLCSTVSGRPLCCLLQEQQPPFVVVPDHADLCVALLHHACISWWQVRLVISGSGEDIQVLAEPPLELSTYPSFILQHCVNASLQLYARHPIDDCKTEGPSLTPD